MSATVHHGPDNPVTGKELFGKWNWDVPVDAHWEKLSLIEKQKWNIFARKVNLKDVTPPEPVERRTNVNNLTEEDLKPPGRPTEQNLAAKYSRLGEIKVEPTVKLPPPPLADWERELLEFKPPAKREPYISKFVKEQPGSLYTGRKVDAEYEGSPADLHDRAEQAFKDAVKATAEDPVLAKRFIEQFIGNFVDDAALFLR